MRLEIRLVAEDESEVYEVNWWETRDGYHIAQLRTMFSEASMAASCPPWDLPEKDKAC